MEEKIKNINKNQHKVITDSQDNYIQPFYRSYKLQFYNKHFPVLTSLFATHTDSSPSSSSSSPIKKKHSKLKKNLTNIFHGEDYLSSIIEKILEKERAKSSFKHHKKKYPKRVNINLFEDSVNNIDNNKLNIDSCRIKSKITYNIKKQYDDLSDKKTSYLKEERDEYKAKCNKYEKMIKEKDDSLNIINNELRNLDLKSKEEISFLKLQLNSKIEELNSRVSIYEEQISALALYKNENEVLKEKNDLYRDEMIKMQSHYKAEKAEYVIQIKTLTEKLKIYDNMENELDNVIDQASGDAKNGNKEIGDIIKDISISKKRRINQCLTLASKVKMLSVENENLKK